MSHDRVADGIVQSVEHATNKDKVNVTNLLQMLFESADRHIESAMVLEGESILLKVGFRTSILEPFPKFSGAFVPETFSAVDILGLVPALALMVSKEEKFLTMSAIETEGSLTRLILGFEGDNLRQASHSLSRFMERWDKFGRVLLNILETDMTFELDWREFLAGESGFITMDWYIPLSVQTQELALNMVKMASKSLLQSILNRKQLEEPSIQKLIRWIEGLRPQPIVVGVTGIPVEGEA